MVSLQWILLPFQSSGAAISISLPGSNTPASMAFYTSSLSALNLSAMILSTYAFDSGFIYSESEAASWYSRTYLPASFRYRTVASSAWRVILPPPRPYDFEQLYFLFNNCHFVLTKIAEVIKILKHLVYKSNYCVQ